MRGKKAALRSERVRRTVVVLATALALIALNLLANRFVTLGLDLSRTEIYAISELSREYIASLDEDIELVIISSEPDARIVKFAQKYARLSEHISLRIANPVYEPSVLAQYGTEEQTVVFAGSGGRMEPVSFSDIVHYDKMQYVYYGEYKETAFDADSRFTNAIAALLSDSAKKVYCVSGHAEAGLPEAVLREMEKSRFELAEVNLLTAGGVPEDCDVLIINAPQIDLAAEELKMLDGYMDAGGHCMLLLAEDEGEALPKWSALLSARGIALESGTVGDGEDYYQNEYLIFPRLSTANSVTGRIAGGRSCLINRARGISLSESPEGSGWTVSALMTSSERGYLSEAGGECSEYGTVILGALASNRQCGGYLFVLPASLIDGTILANYGNVCNLELYMNAAAEGFEDFDSFTIAPVSLSMSYNAIPHAYAGAAVPAALVPVLLLCFGLIRLFVRRRR